MNSYDVKVYVNKNPKFPEECVVCGKNNYGQVVKIQANPHGYYGYWKWQLGMNKKIIIPTHTNCGKNLKTSLFVRSFFLFVIAFISIVITINMEWGRLELLSLCAIFITPPILWQLHNPPHVEFISEGSTTTFTFKNKNYAEKFAHLNNLNLVESDV